MLFIVAGTLIRWVGRLDHVPARRQGNLSKGVKCDYVRVVEAYRDDAGKTQHRTVINLGRRDLLAAHLDFDKLRRLLHGEHQDLHEAPVLGAALERRGFVVGGRYDICVRQLSVRVPERQLVPANIVGG